MESYEAGKLKKVTVMTGRGWIKFVPLNEDTDSKGKPGNTIKNIRPHYQRGGADHQ